MALTTPKAKRVISNIRKEFDAPLSSIAADPVVSILWGTLGFGETVRGGLFLGLAAICAAGIGGGVYLLSRSPLVVDEEDDPHAKPAAANPAVAGSEGPG